MNELVYVENIKVFDIPDKLEIMLFDDASVVILHHDTSKNKESFPIEMERWEYSNEDKDHYIVGKYSITGNMKPKQIQSLSHKINKLIKSYNLLK